MVKNRRYSNITVTNDRSVEHGPRLSNMQRLTLKRVRLLLPCLPGNSSLNGASWNI